MRLALGVVCTIIAASAEGYSIALVKKVMDEAFISQNMDVLYLLGLQVVFAFFMKGAFGYAKSLVMSKAGLKISATLQERIYRHVIRINIDAIQKDGIGKFLNYFSIQAGAVLHLVTYQIISIVQNVSSLGIALVLMFWFAPQLVGIMLVLVPALIVPLIIISRYKNKKIRESFSIANSSSQQVNQSLHGIKTIQAFNMQDYESERFADFMSKSIRNAYKSTVADALRTPLMEVILAAGMGISLIIGGRFIMGGSISVGDFVAFLLALFAAYQPAKAMTGIGGSIQHGLISAEILFAFLDSQPTIRDADNAAELVGDKMKVEFENVSFAYNQADGDVLHDVDLVVPSGKICAFVGPSGGGKTTLFNLLERFYDPSQGRVLINGKDIKTLTLASLRRHIADVSQDVFLFNDSIEDNIRYGAPDATDEQVIAASKIANAHDFITELPQKYKTIVGERGSMLSGGQKQRIAIARAVLKNAPILLLDEATSALDTESEKLIQSALRKLMKGRTVFVIAHRLSTILDADMICVVKDGKIIERGTDEELMAMNGEYKKLRDIQFKTQS